MGLSPKDFLDVAIRPALRTLGKMYATEAAERLLLGTAAHEGFGLRCLRQIGGGPAIGLFGFEPVTYHDLWTRYIDKHPETAAALLSMSCQINTRTGRPEPQEMGWNLRFAAGMARINYFAQPFNFSSVEPPTTELAAIWHKFWCRGCKGTPEKWIAAYDKYARPIYG